MAPQKQKSRRRRVRADHSLRTRFQRLVPALVPVGSRLVVISKGDEDLLRLDHLKAEHFSQTRAGEPVHYWPSGSLSAMVQLEAARARGAQYLAIPQTFSWWLDHYHDFHKHLKTRYRLQHADDRAGHLYDLRAVVAPQATSAGGAMTRFLSPSLETAQTQTAVLDWGADLDPVTLPESVLLFSPPGADLNRNHLPYLDDSVDIVAIAGGDIRRRTEAWRVARQGVLSVHHSPDTIDFQRKRPSLAATTASVSIVVPTYNGGERVLCCLRAVVETLPADFRGEILVVDDASTDDSRRLLEQYARVEPVVRVLANDQNLGFIRSCNHAARSAIGDILVFLNDDTLPLPGWLSPLVSLLQTVDDAGAAGAQLLYPDGSLQEAGAVIFRDATGANVGRGDYHPERPLYSFVRAVDYCSGAVLATPRELFLGSGGFDEQYCPAYYEDSDYCFRLRSIGRKTYYQPSSKVIHLEGASNGRSADAGTKRYQNVNRAKFLQRWQSVIAHQPSSPPHFGLSTWYALMHAHDHGNGGGP
ncbi:MAG TPA: glycosyltransferase family 2 protein [Pirellulales bacterium]|nr:glycosyltransferase family 2 protein [Pirellulales bacterium]